MLEMKTDDLYFHISLLFYSSGRNTLAFSMNILCFILCVKCQCPVLRVLIPVFVNVTIVQFLLLFFSDLHFTDWS